VVEPQTILTMLLFTIDAHYGSMFVNTLQDTLTDMFITALILYGPPELASTTFLRPKCESLYSFVNIRPYYTDVSIILEYITLFSHSVAIKVETQVVVVPRSIHIRYLYCAAGITFSFVKLTILLHFMSQKPSPVRKSHRNSIGNENKTFK
jgi:hypothetical protein